MMKNKEFICKLHNAGGQSILAVCDIAIIGKTIKFRDTDFHVSESFYGKTISSKEEILSKAKSADIVNGVGKNAVDLLVKNGFVDEKCVLWLDEKTPHVQIVRL